MPSPPRPSPRATGHWQGNEQLSQRAQRVTDKGTSVGTGCCIPWRAGTPIAAAATDVDRPVPRSTLAAAAGGGGTTRSGQHPGEPVRRRGRVCTPACCLPRLADNRGWPLGPARMFPYPARDRRRVQPGGGGTARRGQAAGTTVTEDKDEHGRRRLLHPHAALARRAWPPSATKASAAPSPPVIHSSVHPALWDVRTDERRSLLRPPGCYRSHLPRMKSGKRTGRLPWATDCSLSGPATLHPAASYTSMSGGRPSRRHCISR